MLTKIAATNYKNLALAEGITLSNLNIFIGPNGSGKSNLIALIQFLKNCFQSVDSIRGVTAFEDAVSRLGGAKILDGQIERPAVVSLEFGYDKNLKRQEWGYMTLASLHKLTLLVQDAHTPIKIHEESFHDTPADKNYEIIYHYQNEKLNTIEGYKIDASLDYSINELKLKLLTMGPYGTSYEIFFTRLDIATVLAVFLAGAIHIYNANDMNLKQIRDTEPKIGGANMFLSNPGDNLALVLDNLFQESLDFDETFNQAMKAILPATRKVRPIRAGRLSLTVEWHFEGMTEPFYLDELSDGTVRMLCWATVLLSPTLPALLIIEEPELGIHAAWLPILAEWIKQAAERTQVIISTHSPDLLDHFSDRVENVYVFHPLADDQNHFTVKRLSQSDVASWFNEGWQLGDLYRVGDPSVGGWPW